MQTLTTKHKKHLTKYEGIFYKEIINQNNKVVDKIFLIRYRDMYSDKQLTIGKFSSGIRAEYCKNKRDEIVNKLRLGEEVDVAKIKVNFYEVFEKYIAYVKNNKKTWQQDQNAFYNHLEKYKNYDLRQLTSDLFEKLKLKKLKDGYKPRTVQYILALARQIINFAINKDLIKNYINPISKGRFQMPKVENEKKGYLTKEQAKQLLNILKNKSYPLAYRLTVLLLHTGARFSEVTSLTWYDIDFQNRLIYFKPTKNGAERKVYMTDLVLDILNNLKNEQTSNLIIPSTKNTQITQMPKQWQKEVDNLIPNNTDAGKYRITVHSLRHTHASWMAISGISIMHIKEQLGHKKLEMTMRYSHLIPSQRHENTKEIFDS
jgi:integrase